MKINNLGISLIKSFEGLKLNAYTCSAGVWTIGYGTTKYPNGKPVCEQDSCTAELAEDYLRRDLAKFEEEVTAATKGVDLNENQFSALVSLVYNIGGANFKKSTLLKRLKSGDFDEAADEFLVWRKAGGKVLAGLERRRAAERELFLCEV